MKTVKTRSPMKGSVEMKVVTKEGKTYNLGKQIERNWLSKKIQNLRIAYYRWHRARQLEEKEKAEFQEQVDQLRRITNG